MRKVTLERHENRYVGTSYARDGKTVALKLKLEMKRAELTPDEKGFLGFISNIPSLSIKDGKVLKWAPVGGAKYKIYELEKALSKVYEVRFGNCSIEYSQDPKNYLQRLGVGKCIAGYGLKQKNRYESKPSME